MTRVFWALSLILAASTALASAGTQPDLKPIEKTIATEFNRIRQQAGLNPLAVRDDRRVRMEACSVQVKGPDPFVDIEKQNRKFWYLTADPKNANDELVRLAKTKTSFDHVAVGAWFATTPQYPSGMYWIVVYPEHSAAHEAFWGHFYLTDDFEYETSFSNHWKQGLPSECRSIP